MKTISQLEVIKNRIEASCGHMSKAFYKFSETSFEIFFRMVIRYITKQISKVAEDGLQGPF